MQNLTQEYLSEVASLLKMTSFFETKLEEYKIKLSLLAHFNPSIIFDKLSEPNMKAITKNKLKQLFTDFMSVVSDQELDYIFQLYSFDGQGIKWDDFIQMIQPIDQFYGLTEKSNENPQVVMDILMHFHLLIKVELQFYRQAEPKRMIIYEKYKENGQQFSEIVCNSKKQITQDSLMQFMRKQKYYFNSLDYSSLQKRLLVKSNEAITQSNFIKYCPLIPFKVLASRSPDYKLIQTKNLIPQQMPMPEAFQAKDQFVPQIPDIYYQQTARPDTTWQQKTNYEFYTGQKPNQLFDQTQQKFKPEKELVFTQFNETQEFPGNLKQMSSERDQANNQSGLLDKFISNINQGQQNLRHQRSDQVFTRPPLAKTYQQQFSKNQASQPTYNTTVPQFYNSGNNQDSQRVNQLDQFTNHETKQPISNKISPIKKKIFDNNTSDQVLSRTLNNRSLSQTSLPNQVLQAYNQATVPQNTGPAIRSKKYIETNSRPMSYAADDKSLKMAKLQKCVDVFKLYQPYGRDQAREHPKFTQTQNDLISNLEEESQSINSLNDNRKLMQVGQRIEKHVLYYLDEQEKCKIQELLHKIYQQNIPSAQISQLINIVSEENVNEVIQKLSKQSDLVQEDFTKILAKINQYNLWSKLNNENQQQLVSLIQAMAKQGEIQFEYIQQCIDFNEHYNIEKLIKKMLQSMRVQTPMDQYSSITIHQFNHISKQFQEELLNEHVWNIYKEMINQLNLTTISDQYFIYKHLVRYHELTQYNIDNYINGITHIQQIEHLLQPEIYNIIQGQLIESVEDNQGILNNLQKCLNILKQLDVELLQAKCQSNNSMKMLIGIMSDKIKSKQSGDNEVQQFNLYMKQKSCYGLILDTYCLNRLLNIQDNKLDKCNEYFKYYKSQIQHLIDSESHSFEDKLIIYNLVLQSIDGIKILKQGKQGKSNLQQMYELIEQDILNHYIANKYEVNFEDDKDPFTGDLMFKEQKQKWKEDENKLKVEINKQSIDSTLLINISNLFHANSQGTAYLYYTISRLLVLQFEDMSIKEQCACLYYLTSIDKLFMIDQQVSHLKLNEFQELAGKDQLQCAISILYYSLISFNHKGSIINTFVTIINQNVKHFPEIDVHQSQLLILIQKLFMLEFPSSQKLQLNVIEQTQLHSNFQQHWMDLQDHQDPLCQDMQKHLDNNKYIYELNFTVDIWRFLYVFEKDQTVIICLSKKFYLGRTQAALQELQILKRLLRQLNYKLRILDRHEYFKYTTRREKNMYIQEKLRHLSKGEKEEKQLYYDY